MTGTANSSRATRSTAAIGLLFLLGGCESDPSSSSVGGRSGAFTLDILTVRDCHAPAYEKLAPDQRLVGVEVEVRANQRDVPANFYYGRLNDAQGKTYRPTFAGCSPTLSSSPLGTGEVKRGFVNFKLPARATGLQFSYAPRLGSSAAQPTSSVTLPLGR